MTAHIRSAAALLLLLLASPAAGAEHGQKSVACPHCAARANPHSHHGQERNLPVARALDRRAVSNYSLLTARIDRNTSARAARAAFIELFRSPRAVLQVTLKSDHQKWFTRFGAAYDLVFGDLLTQVSAGTATWRSGSLSESGLWIPFTGRGGISAGETLWEADFASPDASFISSAVSIERLQIHDGETWSDASFPLAFERLVGEEPPQEALSQVLDLLMLACPQCGAGARTQLGITFRPRGGAAH
jgi:hypothetical protein